MKTIINSLLVFSFSCAAMAADPVTNLKLLKERRSQLILPSYTFENKKDVVDQARLILGDVFVHRLLKLEHFGAAIDPLPMLKVLEETMNGMDEVTFHSKMREIFQAQRDLHTSYQMPYPYMCYRSFVPVEFKEVIALNGQKVIAVKNIVDSEALRKILLDGSSLDTVQLGDVLLKYDGVEVEEALKFLEAESGGANPAAVRRVAVSSLGFSSQKYEVVPTKDLITLTLKNRLGKVYSVTLPWISKENETCLKDSAPTMGSKAVAENDNINEINEIFRQTKKTTTQNKNIVTGWKTAGDPILKYKVINNEFGRFGLFDLESFSPSILGVDALIQEFKKIIETDFAKTDGIIIDLRDNGGGYIGLGEGLSQLFTANNIQPAGFRMKNSLANAHYVNGTLGETNPFRIALKEAMEKGSYYTEPKNISSAEDINRLGQFYFRPVAILNNASCYSSCDLFSALMQDHGAAVIFGEDPNTGAGGANNVQLNTVISQLGKENLGPFKRLPRGQNIGFSFRQMIRVGSHAGELIEDDGVKADFLVEAKISDLYTESGDQLKAVSRKLNEMSSEFVSSVKLKNTNRQDLIKNNTPTLFASWEQTSNIVIKSQGEIIGDEPIELDNLEGREVSLGDGVDTSSFKLGELEILGMLNEKRVWRKVITYRVIPSTVALPENGIDLKFESSSISPLTIYSSKENEGWNVRDGVLTIGNGKYVDNLHSEAALFLELPAKPKKLSFDAFVKTEKDFDYFQVLGIVDGKEISLVEKMSGTIEQKKYEVDLASYAGKKIEIRFVFDADGGVVDEGPRVDNLEIK